MTEDNPTPDVPTVDDDICGHPTTDGVCHNPATEGSHCWIDSHGGDVGGHGRPSKLQDRWDDIMGAAKAGATLEGCARIAGVDESTLHRWRNEHDDFSEALKRARAQGELRHLRDVHDSGSRFVLERSFGYTKTERREVDADVEHSGSVDAEVGLDEETADLMRDAMRQRREGGD